MEYILMYMGSSILELSLKEASEQFEGPDELVEALVEEKKEQFDEHEIPLSDEQEEKLYEFFRDALKEKELWG